MKIWSNLQSSVRKLDLSKLLDRVQATSQQELLGLSLMTLPDAEVWLPLLACCPLCA